MKPSVKPLVSKTKKKEVTKQEIHTLNKKKVLPVIVKKQKKGSLSKITHSTKRYGKQVAKNILLSKVFHVLFKIIIGALLFFGVSYGLYGYFNKSLVNDIVVSKSEIVDRVAKLTLLPKGAPDAIVRVEDPDTLKKQNSFYENVKIGDYILIYQKLAVIYDLRNNLILAIKKSE
jgi:hypothetical protein